MTTYGDETWPAYIQVHVHTYILLLLLLLVLVLVLFASTIIMPIVPS